MLPFLILSAAFAAAPPNPQTPPAAPQPDARVIAALRATQLKFSIDPSGDVLVKFNVPGNRTQTVAIKSATYKIGVAEFRTLRSIGYKFTGDLPGDAANRFLRANTECKSGTWEIHGKPNEACYLMLVARVDANLDGITLRDILVSMANAADFTEKSVSGKDEW